jgi:hypothetical protein
MLNLNTDSTRNTSSAVDASVEFKTVVVVSNVVLLVKQPPLLRVTMRLHFWVAPERYTLKIDVEVESARKDAIVGAGTSRMSALFQITVVDNNQRRTDAAGVVNTPIR